jgi:hypothetical protein
VSIISVRPIQVVIIPSWLAEKTSRVGKPDYAQFLSFSSLAESVEKDDSILSMDELNFYIAVQLQKHKLLGELFSDIPSICCTEENLKYITGEVTPTQDRHGRALHMSHDSLLERAREPIRKILDSERLQLAIERKSDPDAKSTVFDPEHYVPLYGSENTLYLIGAIEPVYPDQRSFCDAVLTALGDMYDYTQLKTLHVMRAFLRDGV